LIYLFSSSRMQALYSGPRKIAACKGTFANFCIQKFSDEHKSRKSLIPSFACSRSISSGASNFLPRSHTLPVHDACGVRTALHVHAIKVSLHILYSVFEKERYFECNIYCTLCMVLVCMAKSMIKRLATSTACSVFISLHL